MPSPAHLRSTIAALAAPPEDLRAVAAYHKALSDPTRLRLMQRLAEGPATVNELTSHVDLSQPLVSFHLAPAQGGRRGRDAPLRARGHLHAQSRRPDSLPGAGARAPWAGLRDERSCRTRRLTRSGVPRRFPRTHRGSGRGNLHPHAPDAEHAHSDRLRHLPSSARTWPRSSLDRRPVWSSAFGAAFDLFDGALARATGKSSKFGAFMDSTLRPRGRGRRLRGPRRRVAALGDANGAVLAAAAMAAAFMVSYARAKSESLGFGSGTGIANVGFAPREVRSVILVIGPDRRGVRLLPRGVARIGALALIAVLATVTTIQRILFVYQQSKQSPN